MKQMIFVAGLIVIIGAGAWYFFGPGSDMSGTYVGRNASQAWLVQIVQGQGGQLTGFYEESGLSQDQLSLDQDNIPLSGQRDGKTFTVTLEPNGLAHFFGGNTSLAGIYSGTGITLNGQGNSFWANLNLVKGSSADYSSFVAGLNAQIATAQQAKNADALEQKIEAMIRAMGTVPAPVTTRVVQLETGARQIQAMTDKMQAAWAGALAAGGMQSSYGQNVVGAIQTENIQEQTAIIGVQTHFDEVETSGIPKALKDVQSMDAQCVLVGAVAPAQAGFTGPPAELADCLQIEGATPGLENEVAQLITAYQNLFSVWQVENGKQQAIIQQSYH